MGDVRGADPEWLLGRERLVERVIMELLAARALTGTQAVKLGTALMKGKTLAPTHPDPDIDPEPGILQASGAMTAAADRLRDAATGRGKD